MGRSGRHLSLETQLSSTCCHLFDNPVANNAGVLYRLPEEIRRYIYEELFGNRQVHVLSYNAGREEESLMGFGKMRKGKIPRWVHFICCPTPHKGPHEHNDYTHKWCQLSASLILTCKIIYNEGVPVLYESNRFMFDRNTDLPGFRSITGHIFDHHIRELSLVSSMLQFPELHEGLLKLAKKRPSLDIEIMLLKQNMAAGTFGNAIIKSLEKIDDELKDDRAKVIKLKFFLGNKTFPFASKKLQALEVSSHEITSSHDQCSRISY